MKKIIKFLGLITLICFSFFYTDKVMNVVSEQDPLKVEINSVADSYKINPNEAIIEKDTIIPGNNGKKVNVEKSYKKMRKNNIFNKNLLIYDTLYPTYKLSENLDKYIIKGSINNKSISVILIINNNNNLEKIINIFNTKKIKANLFIEYNYLNNNINEIKNYTNHNIYSYQENYTYDSLIISNNIIKRISNNEPLYCLTKEKNKSNLNVCSYSKLNTIIPNVQGGINEVKSNLDNGSIILLNTNNINEVSYIIEFIIKKGYKVVGLDKLLDENI